MAILNLDWLIPSAAEGGEREDERHVRRERVEGVGKGGWRGCGEEGRQGE